MGTPCLSACTPWTTADNIMAGSCTVDDEALLEDMIAVASDVLFELSGRRFAGSCERDEWPIRASCSCDPCACSPYPCGSVVSLPGYPITGITEVVVDIETNEILDSSKYRVDDHMLLVRTDGNKWPAHNKTKHAATGVWKVTFTYGMMPPPAGVEAAKALACELAKAAQGQDCALSEKATSVARQGVTIQVRDPSTYLDEKRRTGIKAVDTFLATYNPDNRSRPPGIYSPELDSSTFAGT